MENCDQWSILCARMNLLGTLLDNLTAKAMDLLKADRANALPLMAPARLQEEMTAMRIEARGLVKTIRQEVAEIKAGA